MPAQTQPDWPTLEVARLAFLGSVQRLLDAAEDARRDRDRLLELAKVPAGPAKAREAAAR